MKKYFLGMTSAVVSLAVLTTLAFGQISLPLMASIPFAFTVQDKQLPAGEYSVREIGGNPNALVIRSENGSGKPVSVLTITGASLRPKDKGELVFDRIGNRYFLKDVYSPGNFGRVIPEGSTERHWERSSERVSASNIQETTVPCSTK